MSGTRIAVADVVLLHLRLGNSLEEIAAKFQLNLPAVHAAMAYYYDQRSEVDAQIAEESAFADEQREAYEDSSPLSRKLAALG